MRGTDPITLIRCSKPAWPSSRASAFGAAEGPIAGGAVCSLKPLTRSFGPKAPGSLKSERGVGVRERVFSEARVSTLGGPTARSLAPLLSRETISNCGFRAYLGCTPCRSTPESTSTPAALTTSSPANPSPQARRSPSTTPCATTRSSTSPPTASAARHAVVTASPAGRISPPSAKRTTEASSRRR